MGVVISICFLCNCPYLLIYHTVYDFVLTSVPKIFTTPLEPSVVSDVCNILELTENDPRRQTKLMYAYEFFPDFHKRYANDISQQQIDNEIGKYLVNCTDWEVDKFDGVTEQFCIYDFRGDRLFTLYFRFSKQGCDNSKAIVADFCTYKMWSLPFYSFQCSESGFMRQPIVRTVERYSYDSYYRRLCKDIETVK